MDSRSPPPGRSSSSTSPRSPPSPRGTWLPPTVSPSSSASASSRCSSMRASRTTSTSPSSPSGPSWWSSSTIGPRSASCACASNAPASTWRKSSTPWPRRATGEPAQAVPRAPSPKSPTTISTLSSESSGARPLGDRVKEPGTDDFHQLRQQGDQLQDRLLRPRPVWEDDQFAVHLQQDSARVEGQDDFAGHRGRPHAVLRLPPPRPGEHPRLHHPLPSLHRPRPGLLRREPQADPQGGRRRDLRRRQPGGADGSHNRVDPQPGGQPQGAWVRPLDHSVRPAVQQARPSHRGAGRRDVPDPQLQARADLRGGRHHRRGSLRYVEVRGQTDPDRAQEALKREACPKPPLKPLKLSTRCSPRSTRLSRPCTAGAGPKPPSSSRA